MPVSKSEIFSTYHDNQREVDITVYEGEDPEPKNNTLIGQFRVEGLRKASEGNPIVINFNLDLNGMLKVTATEKETGFKKTVTLDTRGARSDSQAGRSQEKYPTARRRAGRKQGRSSEVR